MSKITKPYFVIYNSEKEIIESGEKTSSVFTGQPFAEFDTEEELNSFIAEQQLQYPYEDEMFLE